MNPLPDLIPAYEARRKALLAELAAVESKSARQQLELALFVSDVAIATLHDVQQSLERQGDILRQRSEAHATASQAALSRMAAATEGLGRADTALDANTQRFVAAVGRFEVGALSSAIELELLQSALLQSMGLMWIELLGQLYTAQNRQVFFARLDTLFELVSTKLPVVGEILEVLKTLAEVYAIRKKQAQDADAYLLSLESYVDAANIYLCGVMAFCEGADHLSSGTGSPSIDRVQQRLANHVQRIADGTHPTSAVHEAA